MVRDGTSGAEGEAGAGASMVSMAFTNWTKTTVMAITRNGSQRKREQKWGQTGGDGSSNIRQLVRGDCDGSNGNRSGSADGGGGNGICWPIMSRAIVEVCPVEKIQLFVWCLPTT